MKAVLASAIILALVAIAASRSTAQERTLRQINSLPVAPKLAPRLNPSGNKASSRPEQVLERKTLCGGREEDCRILRDFRSPFANQPVGPGVVQPFVLKGIQIPGAVGTPLPPFITLKQPPRPAQASPPQQPPRLQKPEPGSVNNFVLLVVPGLGGRIKIGALGFPTRVAEVGTTETSGDGFVANAAALAPQDPALLAVGIRHGFDQLCTGVLLGPRHVLTAGHCGCSNPSTYEVILGENARPPNPGIKLAQSPILFDARSCPETGRPIPGKDLALLILDQPFSCARGASVQIDPTALAVTSKSPPTNALIADCEPPTQRPPPDGNRTTFGVPGELFGTLQPPITVGQKLLVVGYGYIDDINLGVRAQAPIPVKSVACTERTLERFCQPFTEMILADKPGSGLGSDTCRGDSGGPVFLTDGDAYRLIAITSRAGPGAQSDTVAHCGGGGIYTLVGRQSVLDWLSLNGVQEAQLVPLARRESN